MDGEAPVCQDRLPAGPGWDYLLDTADMPIPLGPQELGLIKRTDGRRNLKTILGQVSVSNPKKLIYFLRYLLQQGMIVVRTRP